MGSGEVSAVPRRTLLADADQDIVDAWSDVATKQ